MKKHLAGLSIALALFASGAVAQTINNLGAGAAVSGTDMFPAYQGANPAKRVTAAQINTYIQSVWGAGIATFLGTPSSANLASALTDETGSGAAVFGTAPTISSLNATTAMTLAFLTGSTQCVQVNSSGVVSGTGSACGGSGSTGANPTATAGPTAINGVATTFMRSDAAPAVQTGSSLQKGILQVDGTTITESSGVISASPRSAVNPQTGTSYAIANGDQNKLVTFSNASAVACTIAQAGSGGNFFAGWAVSLKNLGVGTVTCTPSTSTVDGAATFTLTTGQGVDLYSDGTNYFTQPGAARNASDLSTGTLAAARGGAGTINGALKGNGSGVVSQAACADLSNGTALCSTSPGTGVATALAANLSAAGGVTTTIASGTAALGTSAISSGACATVVTATATGTATTDVVLASFNGDPTAVTGYVPATTGMLTIITYPTANTFNAKVCNNTSSSVTPGAITLNWRVVR